MTKNIIRKKSLGISIRNLTNDQRLMTLILESKEVLDY